MSGLDGFVKLLLHCDGTDGSTTFLDSSFSPKTITAVGNAQLDTAQKKFGTASGLFDGNDSLTAIASTDWNFGTDNFTIDFWIRFNAIGGGGGVSPNNQYFIDIGSNKSCIKWYNGNWEVYTDLIGGQKVLTWANTPSINTWYHVAVVRNGNTWYLFVDGISRNSNTSSNSFGSSSLVLTIGNYGGGGSYGLNGWLDELRISKGTARWTTTFTPPTEEYNNKVKQTITSDIEFSHLREKIESDIHFKVEGLQEIITSDVEFSPLIEKISSDVHFKAEGFQQIIESDVEFLNRKQEIINSDIYFIEEYDGKFIHDNHLFLVTDTNPTQIIKIDLTNPASYTKYTITGKTNGKDLVINHDREYLYASLSGGYIVKASTDDPSIQTIHDIGEGNQLYSITHNPNYLTTFIADAAAGDSLFILDEATYEKINTDFRTKAEEESQIKTSFGTTFGSKINTDFRTIATNKSQINTDLRFIKISYPEISYTNPLARTDFHVKIDDVELGNDDLKLDSIKINHTADNKSTADFVLNRKHDDLNNPTTITSNNNVKIYLGTKLEFEGIIIKINSRSEEELVDIYCETINVNTNYNIVTKDLPLTVLNEKLHLYDILVNDISIEKPYLSTLLVILGNNNKYWNGTIWVSKITEALTFATFALAESYITANETNDSFYSKEPTVSNYEESPQYYKGIKVNLGTRIDERDIQFSGEHDNFRTAQELEEGTFKFTPNYTYFWTVDVKWFNLTGSQRTSGQRYIGTSLAPINEDLFEIREAYYKKQRILDDIITELGYYTIGTAPFKEISVKNGIKKARFRYEDKDDGLYRTIGNIYDYEQYCKDVAAIEYKKIKNINGEVLPKSSANLQLTIDGYLYYDLKLLTRTNITNTTSSNIYKNSNGFPVSIKQITIDSSTMSVNLVCDNTKSNYELELLDGQYPIEPAEKPAFSYKFYQKWDLSNWENIEVFN